MSAQYVGSVLFFISLQISIFWVQRKVLQKPLNVATISFMKWLITLQAVLLLVFFYGLEAVQSIRVLVGK